MYSRKMALDAIEFARKNFITYLLRVIPRVLVILGFGAIVLVPLGLIFSSSKHNPTEFVAWFSALCFIVAFLLILFAMQFVKYTVQLSVVRGIEVPLFIRPKLRVMGALLGAGLLSLCLILPALLLLIVPGIWVYLRLRMADLYILDGHGPIDALNRSWVLTRSMSRDLLKFSFILFGLSVVNTLAQLSLLAVIVSLLNSVVWLFIGLVFARLYVLLLEDEKSEKSSI